MNSKEIEGHGDRNGIEQKMAIVDKIEAAPMERRGNKIEVTDSPPSPSSTSPISISNNDASSLIMKMVSMGYFQKNNDVNLDSRSSEEVETDLTIESKKQQQTKLIERRNFKCDKDCMLVFNPSQLTNYNVNEAKDEEKFCMTREYLNKEIYSLVTQRGRISLITICDQLKISIADVKQAVKGDILKKIPSRSIDEVGDDDSNIEFNNQIHFIEKQNELVTDSYLNDIFQSKVVSKLDKDGTICISDLSMTTFHLPVEFMTDAVEKRLNIITTDRNSDDTSSSSNSNQAFENSTVGWSFRSDVKSITNDGVRKIITARYEKTKKDEVKNSLVDATEPVKLKDVINKIGWNANLILSHIQYLCESGEVKGDLRTDSTNKVSGAIFVPFFYEQKQRNFVEELFHTNGYITYNQANQAGVSIKRVKKYILDIENEKAIICKECVVHSDKIIAPLQLSIEECIETESFVDISLHLPSDILCCKDDVHSIMTNHILENLSMAGCFMLDETEAIYFSKPMIDNISKNILPPLIEDFAKARAVQIVDEIDSRKKEITNETENKNKHKQSTKNVKSKDANKFKRNQGKTKNRVKFSKKQEPENHNNSESPKAGIVPLKNVVAVLAQEYSDLFDIQQNYDYDENYEAEWEIDDELEDYEGPLYGFCRIALNNDSKVDHHCSTAVSTEVERILKIRTARRRNIEKAFEENFPVACQFLQLTAKMISSDEQLNEKHMEVMTSDLLDHCACIARRITEYCLFKTGSDIEVTFSFGKDVEDQDYFYSSVDLTQRHFPFVFLTCKSKVTGDWQDPLKALREKMPANLGVGIARMWTFTGGNHYDGGARVDADNCTSIRPGDSRKFISHVKKSCMSMIGYPVTFLDKKIEKKLMFCRYKELKIQLEMATDVVDIFELTVMLLSHQTRSTVVLGKEINGGILDQLVTQKQFPPDVSNILKEVSTLLQNSEPVSEKLLEELRACGLREDIVIDD